MKKSVDPDQLASLEASCSGPTLFSKESIELLKPIYVSFLFLISIQSPNVVIVISIPYSIALKGKNSFPLGANSFL